MDTPAAGNQGSEVVELTLEFARTEQGGDPFVFRAGRQQYLLRSAGGGFETAELTWDRPLLADLDSLRNAQRDPVVTQRLGETLRRFLQPAGWSEHEARILLAVQAQQRVILTLRSAAAELYSLPWELITLKGTGQHIAELPGVLVRYEWPSTTTTPEQPSLQAGRVLLAWSAAGGEVPVARHISAIAALQTTDASGQRVFDTERDVLPHMSLGRLAAALDQAQNSERPITVLHLLCHGGALGTSFGLVLNGDQSEDKVVVDPAHLRQLLAPYARTLRLVILSACESGNDGSLGNQLGSVAQALHRVGLMHVIASRYPLSVTGANQLAETIYRELLHKNGVIEAAILSARQNLARNTSHLDWVSLQYYARAADGNFRPALYLPGARAQAAPITKTESVASRSAAAQKTDPPAPRTMERLRPIFLAGGIAALIVVGIVAYISQPDEQTETQPRAPSAAPFVDHSKPQKVPTISETWRDERLGIVYQLAQSGGSYTFTAHQTDLKFTQRGKGVLTGQRLEHTYETAWNNGQRSTGTCSGEISQDNTLMTASCQDSLIGSWQTTAKP